uniref:SET domain-containing protein n=1 Tax=Seriola lalandi dorsalis TaxID=1841481 RepID=A0A3B4WIY4_SERLL
MDSNHIQKMTGSQRWKGLLVTEGHEVHKNTSPEETGYMFFYTNQRGQPMCIDAHSATCECHPERQTVGRFINHSRAKANLRPRFYSVEEKEVILFLATRNIEVKEELLFDYGVAKKSFRGEGLGLSCNGHCLDDTQAMISKEKDILLTSYHVCV